MAEGLTIGQLREHFPRLALNRQVLPLPDHDLIYVKNQKAGSSTLMVWLDRLHTGEHEALLQHMHKEHRLPTVREVGREQVLRMLSGAAYRFSFVRDPVRRFESVYWAKMVRSHRFRRRAAPGLGLPPDPDQAIDFEEFLEAVERQDPSEMDPHWRPQHRNLLHPLVDYDLVGRLESFDADLDRIRAEARLPWVPVETVNSDPRSDRRSVYEGRPDLRSRVERLYARDMELYGY